MQKALDKYDSSHIEHIIQNNIKKKMWKLRDSDLLYYKRVEKIIDQNDECMTPPMKVFGYKCQLIRSPYHFQYVMEYITPTLAPIVASKPRKVALYERSMRNRGKKLIETQ